MTPLIVAAGSALDADPIELLEAAAGAGCHGVGLRLSAEHRLDHGRAAAVRDRAFELGLTVNDVEVHRITDPEPDPGPLIERAAAVGAGGVLAVSDLDDRAVTERSLTRFASRCRAAGVDPVLEYMAWTLPADPTTAVAMAGETGCRIVVDVLHHHRIGAGPAQLAEVADSGLLAWVQLCDAPAGPPADLVHEARHQRLVPGHGQLDLDGLLAPLPTGVAVSIEVQNDELAATTTPEARIRLLADATRHVLRGIR